MIFQSGDFILNKGGMLMQEKIVVSIVSQLQNFIGEHKVVIGISGGIDSAVVLGLLSKAIPKSSMHTILLPYGDQDISDAEKVCGKFGVKANKIVFDIKPLLSPLLQTITGLSYDKLVKGNIIARFRMLILYAFSNNIHGLVIGTTNKSEYEVGYYTKWGDGAVDCEPIADIYKTDIYPLAEYLGVPQTILNKEPSAELWKGQTDEKELGISYPQLDHILRTTDVANGLPEGTHIINQLIKNNEHKKRTPPIFYIKENSK